MRTLLTAVATVTLVSTVPPTSATVVYTQDFENPAGAEWSLPIRDTAPNGDQFLGRFVNDTYLTLTLGAGSPAWPDALPPHTDIAVGFDLYIIHSWDGSLFGPDLWSFGVAGGPELLLTTFANPLNGTADNPQAFPGTYPADEYPAQTGAVSVNSLGYWNVTPVHFGDSVYRIEYTFPHTADAIQFEFVANGVTGEPLPYGIGDESWGIDNITVAAVPEPAAGFLFVACSLILPLWRGWARAAGRQPGN